MLREGNATSLHPIAVHSVLHLRPHLRAYFASKYATAPPEIASNVERFVQERRGQLDRWFFGIRITLGLTVAGYLSIDLLQGRPATTAIMFTLGAYLAANTATWLYCGARGKHARWIYMSVDFLFVLLLRHAFLFEVLVDPNATMVAFFTLMLLTYTGYADPALSRMLAVLTVAVTALTLCLDMVGAAVPESGVLVYRRYPLRVVLILAYLGAFCLVTSALAFRLREHILDYAVELQKRLETAMANSVERSRTEKLEQLNRLKRDFIEVLSHELRTPLTPLRSSLELLRSTNPKEDDAVLLSIALESTDKLNRLVQDYTRLAELLADERNGVLRWNIKLDSFLDTLRTEHDMSRVVVEDVEDVVVSANPRLLAAALLSLIRRAQLVSSSNSTVTIRAKIQESQVLLSIHDPDSCLDCDVVGMLDDPFLASNERTFDSRNTGLELVLARHSLQRIGGSLHVLSAEDAGTTVVCSLPGRQHGSQWLSEREIKFEVEPLRSFAVET